MKQITRSRLTYALLDYFAVALGWFVFNVLRFFSLPPMLTGNSLVIFLRDPVVLSGQFIVPLGMVALYALWGSYNRENTLFKSRLDEVVTSLTVSFVGMLGIFFIALINDNIPERLTNYELMLMLYLCLFVPDAVCRLVFQTRRARAIGRGDFAIPAVVVGADPTDAARISGIARSQSHAGLRIIACLDCDGVAADDTLAGIPVVRTDYPAAEALRMGAQAFIVMPSVKGASRTAGLLNELYLTDKPIFILADMNGMLMGRPKVSQVTAEPLVDITNANLSATSVNFKRLGDIVASSVALVLLSPLYAFTALLVKLDSPGPVFYRQARIGYHKKPFDIIKFRTMRTDAEPDGPALTVDNDPRVTSLGRVLRKYRLDELPQFWNVLKGEMSLVGPRPERAYFIDRIVARVPAYTLLHQVRPGITSWGMVKYGYAADVDQMIERLPYDLLYIENLSFGLDLKILFHTVATVVKGRGK